MTNRELVLQFVVKPIITCNNCGAQFVLHYINMAQDFSSGSVYKFLVEEEHPNFCPYCGSIISSDVEENQSDDKVYS